MGRKLAGAAVAIALLFVATIAWSPNALAQADLKAAPVAPVTVHALVTTPAAEPAVTFDPVKATNAYLARVSGAARQRSDSYFEGGYVLIFVDALFSIAVSALLLWAGISAAMRNIAQKVTRSRFWQTPIYVAMFVVATTVLTFPLTVYETFFRDAESPFDASITRLFFAELAQRVQRIGLDVFEAGSIDFDLAEPWVEDYLESFSETIAGGTAEIQRNIIGERILGLPRQARP